MHFIEVRPHTLKELVFLVKRKKVPEFSIYFHQHYVTHIFKSKIIFLLSHVLKLVSAIYIRFLFFHQMIPLQKLWKILFLFHEKSSFRSRDNQVFVFLSFPLFLPVGYCFKVWSKINLKVYDAINCLNNNSIHILFDILRKKQVMTLKLCP